MRAPSPPRPCYVRSSPGSGTRPVPSARVLCTIASRRQHVFACGVALERQQPDVDFEKRSVCDGVEYGSIIAPEANSRLRLDSTW